MGYSGFNNMVVTSDPSFRNQSNALVDFKWQSGRKKPRKQSRLYRRATQAVPPARVKGESPGKRGELSPNRFIFDASWNAYPGIIHPKTLEDKLKKKVKAAAKRQKKEDKKARREMALFARGSFHNVIPGLPKELTN